MSANNLSTNNSSPEKKLLNQFLSCLGCGQKTPAIEETKYSVPYDLHKNEVYVCESCKTAFVLYFNNNHSVEKQSISFDCLFHEDAIPF